MKFLQIFTLIISVFVSIGLGFMIGHARGIEQGREFGAQFAGMNIAKDAAFVLNAKANDNGEFVVKKSDLDSLRIAINKFNVAK
jgi:hypothetical protein